VKKLNQEVGKQDQFLIRLPHKEPNKKTHLSMKKKKLDLKIKRKKLDKETWPINGR
jgi:hypothetical protein